MYVCVLVTNNNDKHNQITKTLKFKWKQKITLIWTLNMSIWVKYLTLAKFVSPLF